MKFIPIALLLTVMCFAKYSYSQIDCAVYGDALLYIDSSMHKSDVSDITYREKKIYYFVKKEQKEFSKVEVKSWFSTLMEDSLISHNMLARKNLIRCIIPSRIKYQLVDKSTLQYSEKLELMKIESSKNNNAYYLSSDIMFSSIHFISNNRLCFYIKIWTGEDRTPMYYGFIFKKIDSNWVLNKVRGEIR